MNVNENLNISLVDEDSVPIAKKNCCFYLFCCFLCSSEKDTNSRKFYINKWRKYLSKETDSKGNLSDPFRILTNLWAHKNVIRDLEQIRLNPNLLNTKQIRNDLEFYIPQLCSFMLFGEYETVEEFLAFLCKACFASFSFAHKIVWFLKALMNPYNPYNEKIKTILHLIQTIFKSESKLNVLERLHVAGSKKYIETLLKEESETQIAKRNSIREKIDNFVDSQYFEVLEKMTKADSLEISTEKTETSKVVIKSEEIFLNTFNRYDSVTNDENNILTQYVKQIDKDDINLSSFLSTINFIDHMCNICEILRATPLPDQEKTLLSELRKTNKILPANVYLPFIKDSIRNYVVASIPLSEVKIYRTKNRAPYAITLECFRLDELTYNKIQLLVKNEYAVSSSSSNEEDEEIKFKDNKKKSKNKKKKGVDLNNTTDQFSFQRSHSFKDSLLNDNILITSNADKRNGNTNGDVMTEINKRSGNVTMDLYEQIKEKKTKSFLEPSTNRNDYKRCSVKNINKLSKINYILESDVNISKPVVIKNILSSNSLNNNKSPKKIVEFENLDYDTDVNELMKIDKYVKNEVSNSPKRSNISLDLSDEKIEIEKKLLENPEYTKNEIKEKEEIEEIQNTEENQDKNERITLSSTNKLDADVYSIFGEKIEAQTERLKKTSPFGNLNTYKLFKVIIKSGEDLRQEQFATQLINEFNQIFKLEKVDCWVNPYEIIATGNNVGIIEVVPNAISLDQLKRKSKSITTLKGFYESYYAPVNSDSYKRAMKNFISSLAGYSLVCYFLQIKDRHNANILIDDQGHIIHIDFGFMLSNAPGKGIQFEKAPFKLTNEFVEVMGGVNSNYFTKFRKLLWKGFIAIIKHYEKILILVEMMYCGHGNKLPCFEKGQVAIDELRQRFIPRPNMKVRDYMKHVDSLIEQSIDNWRTKWYDKYQYWVQGIFY